MVADDEATEDLAAIFHLQRTDDGYFLEDHVKLRPVDMSVQGFAVAGTAHSPKSIDESIAQAQAAAGRVQAMLAKETINLGAVLAKVDGEKCAACLLCVRACPYDVPQFGSDGLMQKCDFCLSVGTAPACAASCPAEALEYGPTDELMQIARQKHKQVKLLGGEAMPTMFIVT